MRKKQDSSLILICSEVDGVDMIAYAHEMVRELLEQISDLLQTHGYDASPLIPNFVDDEKLWNYLVSNELWGGSGSIADQALSESPTERKRLEEMLIRLGREQMRLNKVNVRTGMWVSTFEKWKSMGIR